MQIKLSDAQIAQNALKSYNGKEFREVKIQASRPDGNLDELMLSGEPNISGLDKLPLLEKMDLTLEVSSYMSGYNVKLRLLSIRNGKATA